MHDVTLLFIVICAALIFDFTNGFHDTANAMATSIATGALKPRAAVALSAVLNLVGAFLSIKVAATIASGIVASGAITLPIVFAGLLGAILWNMITWSVGLPSSSSHALIGGVIGATLVSAGPSAVHGHSIIAKVVIPALLAPALAGLVAMLATRLSYRIAKPDERPRSHRYFRYGQLASASLVSLAHGTNDAQKTMGVITLALIADKQLRPGADPPMWVIVSCAVALAAGTYFGGWRVIRTMGHRLTRIEAPQGFTAQTASVAVLLTATQGGLPLSTTHITSGAVLGTGLGRRGSKVSWRVAGTMVLAWLLTLPAAALVAAGIGLIVGGGGSGQITVVSVVAVLLLLGFWIWSRRNPVSAANVNEASDSFSTRTLSSIERPPVLEQAAG
ncbi:MAG TPA: inorganic phosphate transporter [Jatrophihabitans sp.]|uniref:inorganic phosphate transporter n=1 Tax=Jatrophihabitans sp. TaxID=1932789 RepID=UPI002EF1AA61